MNPGTQVKNENPRKRSAEDKDIEEWAKKLLTRTGPQIAVAGQTVSTQPDIPAHSNFDFDSAIGRFTWHVVGQDKFVPCLFRSGVKYCCIRMVETSVMGELLNVLPQEIYDSAKLCSHLVSDDNATTAEAKLLTYINSWHCDSFYGPKPFTEEDLVATVQEIEELYAYLMFAYGVLSSAGQNKDGNFTRCGFVRVNNESLIPYTVLRNEPDGEKGVPLFYFEGQTDILKVKAKPLSGWDLAYLKVCCKVQGVRKELIAGDSLNIVKLSDLKAYFPKRTVFTEQCWPPSKGKSLLPKQNLNGLLGSAAVQTQAHNASGQPVRNPLQTPNGIATSMSSTTPTTVVRGPINLVNGIHPNNSANVGNSTVRRDINVNISGVHVGNRQAQNVVNTYSKAQSMPMSKLKAHGPPTDNTSVYVVDEFGGGQQHGAYQPASVNIDMKAVHTINYKPFQKDVIMVVIPHLIYSLIPGLMTNSAIVDLFRRLDINVYLPNDSQRKALNNQYGYAANKSFELPLVAYKDLLPKLNSLKTCLVQSFQHSRANGIIQNPQRVGVTQVYPSNGQRR